jgi:DNA-binding response OmpR family regulator
MDVRLAGKDGVALTRRLKASSDMADIPIVMMTGDARRETLVDSMQAGAAGFVVKPVTRAALQAKLDKILPREPTNNRTRAPSSALSVAKEACHTHLDRPGLDDLDAVEARHSEERPGQDRAAAIASPGKPV